MPATSRRLRAHGGGAEEHTDPGAAEQLAEREDESLRGWIDGGVGGEPIDVEGVKAGPERVRGIGEASVGESVTHEEVAVLVMDAGDRDREEWEDGCANGDHGYEQDEED